MKYLRVKNWEKFQHYTKRTPPWIKLHRDLLRDYSFICLSDSAKLHLMLIWLLASQMDNKIPTDEEFIRKQINIKGKINFNELIDKGFLMDDSNTLAGCKQDAIAETEAEAEAEADIGEKYFDNLWKNWKPYEMPKGNKKTARNKFIKIIKSGVQIEALIIKANQYCSYCNENHIKTKHITTWLNQNGWEDEYKINKGTERERYIGM